MEYVVENIQEKEICIPDELEAKIRANTLSGEDYDAIASIIKKEFGFTDTELDSKEYLKLVMLFDA